MDLPSSEEVGPTEETVLALLDFLVDPLLPSSKFLPKEAQSPPQEELVAKQVHAVVLLYNYYHRKQDPKLEFLEFVSFCKLAVRLKPSLLLYLSLTQKADNVEVEDMDKHLSLTEKEIMNACDISRDLDASNNNPIIEGWPIRKVAVFLVDFKKENGFLFHGSITQGVWSVIEKEVSVPGQDAATEARNKKKRVIKKTVKESQTVDESGLLQVAYSAVKEACGINQGDLKKLEAHTVYSTSKAKTAVRLYIMQFTQSNQDVDLVPLNDAMDSLRGPLVTKEAGSWTVTPVVEYFHLLPFVDKVSNWIWREMLPNNSQHLQAGTETGNGCSSHLEIEQLPSPSHHFEATEEPNSCDSSHLKEEPVLKTPKPFEATKEVRNTSSCQSKEEHLPCASELPEARKEVRNDLQLKEELLPLGSQLAEAAKEVRNGNSCHLNEESLPCDSQYSEAAKEVKSNNSNRRKDEPVVYKKRNRSQKCQNGSKTNNGTVQHTRQEEVCAVTGSSNNMEIDDSFTTCPPVDGKSRSIPSDDNADDQKQVILAQETDQMTCNGGAIVVAEGFDTSSHHHDNEKVLSDNKISDTAMSDQDGKQDLALVSFNPNAKHLHKVQLTVAAKDNLLSQTALKVLFRKRELLSRQLRSIADEIASCDRNIETILSGGEDDLAVKIDSVLEGCTDLCLRNGAAGDKTDVQIEEDPDFTPLKKRKRLSEANLSVHSPCQELDSICNENSWILPTYNISASQGGFEATVTVKGVDFECSSEGTISATPREARNSAASKMLAKLRSMVVES